jgi:predicted dehydrogenase
MSKRQTDMIRVGVLGAGYWGPNLIRNFANLAGCELAAVCEGDSARRQRISNQYPSAVAFGDYDAMLADGSLDAVVVATSVESHFAHAKAALEANKHVLVEKPLAQTSEQCLELIRLAETRHRVLMVGHTFLFNAAVRKVRQLIEAGDLGNILYLYSQRLNLGIVRQDINAMWNLAPHDISIAGYLTGKNPVRVSARGFDYLQDGLPDVVFLTIEYPERLASHIHVSWLDPQKARRMTVVGSKKMVVYDDMSVDARVQIYDKGVDRIDRDTNNTVAPSFGEYQLLVRSGDLTVPQIDFPEPLRTECSHFIDCVRTGESPFTSGWDGLRVVAVLEAADRSIAQGGSPVDVPAELFAAAPMTAATG